MRSFILAFILACIIPLAGMAATIHVPGQYSTIQDAIDAAMNGDTVLVAQGTYVENIDFIGKGITVMSADGPEVTVIDGNQSGSVVVFQLGETNALLQGFKITNGSGKSVPPFNYGMGGGVHCNYGACPVIRDNIISGNTGALGGGIGCVYQSSPVIENNRIIGNTVSGMSSAGGGIYCLWDSDPVIAGNIISSNTVGEYGGGIHCSSDSDPLIECNVISGNTTDVYNGGGIDCFDYSSPTIRSNIIFDNTAKKNGGGISFDLGCAPLITNNILYNNTAVKVGGGIECTDSNPVITNNTLFGNQAGNTGGGMRFGSDTLAEIANTILWDNGAPTGPEIRIGGESTINISHSDVMGGQSSVYLQTGSTLVWGAGMIDFDPTFADPAGNDFHLPFTSPCMDTGDNGAPGIPGTDFEGDPRTAYGTADMGADECSTHLYCMGDLVPGGKVSVKLVGQPATAPVFLFFGSGILDPAIPSMWGDWYLAFPVTGPIDLGTMPAPDGILVLDGTLPSNPAGPYDLPLQALIGITLTNLCVMEVE